MLDGLTGLQMPTFDAYEISPETKELAMEMAEQYTTGLCTMTESVIAMYTRLDKLSIQQHYTVNERNEDSTLKLVHKFDFIQENADGDLSKVWSV